MVKMVKALVKYGANVTAPRGSDGLTPLQVGRHLDSGNE